MILQADARHIPLADNSVQCVVTSPPYFGLRDYKVNGQLGLERTPEEYVANMVAVFREVRRVCREDATVWVNIGDGYNAAGRDGHGTRIGYKQSTNRASANGDDDNRPTANSLKPKDLIGMPWRLAFALQADGWYLRSDIVWAKPNPMPESVTDRPTKSHEYIFLLTNSARYFWDAEAVKEPATHAGKVVTLGEKSLSKGQANGAGVEPSGNGRKDSVIVADGRNLRSVWTIPTQPYPEAHFATFPPEIPKRCILAGTSARGCCTKCGAPWARVVEITSHVGHKPRCDEKRFKCGSGSHGSNGRNYIGWRPTCTCNYAYLDTVCAKDDPAYVPYPTKPCLVLDPFAGSGTTVAVAESLGRRGIGLELKREYIHLAQKRCRATTLGLPL